MLAGLLLLWTGWISCYTPSSASSEGLELVQCLTTNTCLKFEVRLNGLKSDQIFLSQRIVVYILKLVVITQFLSGTQC